METSRFVVYFTIFFTVVMTDVGALPLTFVKDFIYRAIGWSNGIAAGLILAVSHTLSQPQSDRGRRGA